MCSDGLVVPNRVYALRFQAIRGLATMSKLPSPGSFNNRGDAGVIVFCRNLALLTLILERRYMTL
jgi:hypothetical protein